MEMLDMLVEMNKEINACIASEKERYEATEKEREILQENMVREIREDLLKYLEYYKKLEIIKHVFCSGVELNPLGSLYRCKHSYIGVAFYSDRVHLVQMVCLTEDYHCYTSYNIWNSKHEHWENGNSLNIVYENWDEIKKGIEKKIAEEYMKQKTAECRELNCKREKAEEMLKMTAKLLNEEE